jgi:DNA-binding NarL/FixJ family response regulator
MNLGMVAGLRGDYSEAAALGEEAVALHRANGAKPALAYSLVNLAAALREQGTPVRTVALVQESLTLSRELGDQQATAYGLDAMAACAADVGRPELAARLAAGADALRAAIGMPLATLLAADREERLLRPVRATLSPDRYAAAQAAGWALPVDALVDEALAIPGRQRDQVPAAGSLPPDASARQASARAGYGLTPREVEVLRLLVSGSSDKEIAAALYISPRSASKHVSGILGKLGVDSRGAAAVRAVREHLV